MNLSQQNNLESLSISNIEHLNLSQQVNLKYLSVSNANHINIENNNNLKSLSVKNSNHINIENNNHLESLRVNIANDINIENNNKLTDLSISNAKVQHLNFDNHLFLESIELKDIELLSADELIVADLPLLDFLYISNMTINNGLYKLSNLPSLEILRTYQMDFSKFYLHQVPNIATIEVESPRRQDYQKSMLIAVLRAHLVSPIF